MAHIGLRALAQFCHRAGTSLYAGVDVRRFLEMETQRGPLGQRATMEGIRDCVGHGDSLSAAFAQAGDFFPPLVREMVEVGERTGRIDEVFQRLGDHYDNLLQLRRGFLIGIAWPVFELVVALIVIGFLIWILGAIGAEWDGKPVSVLGLYGTRGLLIYLGILAALAGAGATLAMAVQRGWVNLDLVFRLLMNVPGIGLALRNMAISRLTWSLAIATDSDLSAERAIDLAVRSTQNSYYTSQLEAMRRPLRRGEPMHTAFRAAGIYPDDFLDALETGETAGRISETMAVLAKQYEERARQGYRILAVVAGVCVFLFVGAILVFFIVNMFVNLYLNPIRDALKPM
jgi:type IV pilus assembly protein PilC